MSSSKSPVWRAFDRVERKIGQPLEDAVASPRYIDVVLKGKKVQRAVGGAVGRLAGGAVSKVLHVAQIPTRSDVRKLNKQITTLTTEMRALAAAQTEAKQPAKKPTRPRSAAPPGKKAPRGD